MEIPIYDWTVRRRSFRSCLFVMSGTFRCTCYDNGICTWTCKPEEYYKIFYSDEASNKEKEQAAIDAGKLLVFQILENTEDRTGLIESCKEGGSLTLKKTTNDLIEEVLEWMPTMIIVEEKDVLEKPKNKEEKSEKEHLFCYRCSWSWQNACRS